MNSLVGHNIAMLKSLVSSRRKSEETRRQIAARLHIANQHVALYRKFTFSAYCQNMADAIEAEIESIRKSM